MNKLIKLRQFTGRENEWVFVKKDDIISVQDYRLGDNSMGSTVHMSTGVKFTVHDSAEKVVELLTMTRSFPQQVAKG